MCKKGIFFLDFKYFLLLVLLLPSAFNIFGQSDNFYSFYILDQQPLNPAYVGLHNHGIATFHHNKQWLGTDQSPSQSYVSLQSNVIGTSLGLGGVFQNEQFGSIKINSFQPNLSYKIKTNKNSIFSFGLGYHYEQTNINISDINQEFDDPELQNQGTTKRHNLSNGLFWNNPKYYIGYSLSNISLQSQSKKIDHRLSAGYLHTFSCYFRLKPYILARLSNDVAASVDYSMAAIFNDTYWLILQTRNFNSIALGGNIEILDKFRIGYLASLPIKNINNNLNSSHEIMLSYDFAVSKKQFIKQRYW